MFHVNMFMMTKNESINVCHRERFNLTIRMFACMDLNVVVHIWGERNRMNYREKERKKERESRCRLALITNLFLFVIVLGRILESFVIFHRMRSFHCRENVASDD